MDEEQPLFNRLTDIDVSRQVEQKNGLNYLSWSFAWSIIKQIDPAAKMKTTMFKELDNGTLTGREVPFLATRFGVLVEVTVNINGHSETERLPVMDNRNKAVTNPDMMQINKTEKRCFVKACALHGLGLSLYTGEDLPDIVKMENEAAIRIEREKLMTSIKALTQKISSAAGFSRQAVGGKAIQNAGLSGGTRDMTNAQLAKLTVALQNELAEVMKNEDVRQAGEDAGQSDDGTA